MRNEKLEALTRSGARIKFSAHNGNWLKLEQSEGELLLQGESAQGHWREAAEVELTENPSSHSLELLMLAKAFSSESYNTAHLLMI